MVDDSLKSKSYLLIVNPSLLSHVLFSTPSGCFLFRVLHPFFFFFYPHNVILSVVLFFSAAQVFSMGLFTCVNVLHRL